MKKYELTQYELVKVRVALKPPQLGEEYAKQLTMRGTYAFNE